MTCVAVLCSAWLGPLGLRIREPLLDCGTNGIHLFESGFDVAFGKMVGGKGLEQSELAKEDHVEPDIAEFDLREWFGGFGHLVLPLRGCGTERQIFQVADRKSVV